MMVADDAYAGSETYYRLERVVKRFFNKKYFLPAHQGRACEHILAKTLVKPGDVIPMNYHFTTTKTHITLCGGRVEEIFTDEFINSDEVQKALLDISKGVDGATEKLKVLATAQEIKIKAGVEVDNTTIDNLWTEIANLNNQNIEIGATIDEAPALDSLVNLL
jgi:tryptophanase